MAWQAVLACKAWLGKLHSIEKQGYTDKLGHFFGEDEGTQIDWVIFLKENEGAEINAIFLEKNGSEQIRWAIFTERSEVMQID